MQFDENGKLIRPGHIAQAGAQGAAPEVPATVTVEAGTEEGAGFLQEAYRAIAGGAGAAFEEIGETIDWASENAVSALTGGKDVYWTQEDGLEWLDIDEAARRDDIPAWQTRPLLGDGGTIDLPEVADNETLVGGFARGATQFLVGYATLGRQLKMAKSGVVATGLARGAVTDFATFDAHEDRLSNFIQQYPGLQNPVTEFLAADEDDSILEGKLKNAVEGAGLGVATEGVARLFRAFKKAKAAANAGDEVKAAEIMAEAAEDISDAQLDLFDATTDPNLVPDTATPEVRVARAAAEPAPETPYLTAPVAKPKKAPVDTAALGAELDREIALRRGGSFPDPNRTPTSGLFNIETWDSDTQVKDIIEMAGESIHAHGVKDITTFAEIAKESTNLVAEYVDVDPTVIERSLAASAQQAERLPAMIVASKNIIQSLAREVENLAYKVSAGKATAEDMEKFISYKARLVETSANLKSVIRGSAQTTAAGRIRTTDAVSGGELAHSYIVDQITSNIENAGGVEDLKKIAAQIIRAKQQHGVSGVMRVSEGTTSAMHVLNEYWINSILSGPKTQLINFISNGLQMGLLPTEKVIGGALRRDTAAMREGARHFAGLAMSIRESTSHMFQAFREGHNIIDPEAAILEANGVDYHAIKSNRDDMAGKFINTLGTVIRLPTRLLSTGDEFFKQMNYRADLYSKLYGQAYDLVTDGKLTKGQAASWVADRMRAGFNKDGSAKHLESLQFAREATFTNDLRPRSIPKSVQNMTNRHQSLKLILPFVRTPTNILVAFGQRTPGLNYLSRNWQEDLAAGGSRAAIARGKQAVGGAVWGAAVLAAMEGNITGSGPKDKGARDMLLATGWRPYSFKKVRPDGSVEYVEYKRLDPFAMILGIAADISEAGGQMDEGTLSEVALAATIALGNNILAKSYMTGLSSWIQAAQDPSRYGQSLLNSYASSMVPMSSFTREIRKQGDPYMREVRSMLDAAMNTVPGYSDSLPARRSWLTGKPIVYPKGWDMGTGGAIADALHSVNPITGGESNGDATLQELADLRFNFSAPTRKINGVELNSEQYSRLNELHGTVRLGRYTLHQRLEKLFESERYKRFPKNVSDPSVDPRVKAVQKVVTDYRERARRELMREYPEVREQVRGRGKELARNARGGLAGIANLAAE